MKLYALATALKAVSSMVDASGLRIVVQDCAHVFVCHPAGHQERDVSRTVVEPAREEGDRNGPRDQDHTCAEQSSLTHGAGAP